jgi:hypothetical protein
MRMPHRIVVALVAAGALAALPVVAAAKHKPVNLAKQGVYLDTATNVQIGVAKGAQKMSTVTLNCPSTKHEAGTIQLRNVKLSAAGTFKLDGHFSVAYFDSSSHKAKLKITGTFQAHKVVGKITPTGTDGLCDAYSFSAKYYGNRTGG